MLAAIRLEAAMPFADLKDPYHAYREAIRKRVCAVCLDGRDDAGIWIGIDDNN